jgi:hypothetical protein
MNYSALQSDLNFSNKMHEHVDYTQSFAVQKFLAVVSKTNKGNDVRKEITISLVEQIIEALPTIHTINYMSNRRRPYLVKFNFLSEIFKCNFSILVHFPNIVFNGLIN